MFVAMALAKNPLAKISGQLQVGTAWQDRHEIKTLDGRQHGEAWSSWQLVPPEGLATSWREFQELAAANGLHASGAVT